MIGRLQGRIAEKAPPLIVVCVHGVGYEVNVPMSTYYHLGAIGTDVTLLTHLIVREDAHVLYGFLSPGERETFRLLIKITGVGPRMALGVLSGLSVEELARAVATQTSARLVKIPGVGKKTAERLLLELKGKLGEDPLPTPQHSLAPADSAKADVLQALIALGYSDKEAQNATRTLPADIEVTQGIKLALKGLSQ